MTATMGFGSRRLRRTLLGSTALLPLSLGLPAQAQTIAPNARPVGGVVSAGSATIGQTAATTTVTQGSNRAVVDWQGFNVGAQHSVQFRQPSAASWTLNRVNSPDPSVIAGSITANGGVAIVNQAGVVFAGGSQVNVGSLIASAANITNQNFMAGNLVFDGAARPGARIENRGHITIADHGLAALVGPNVRNAGVIDARLGRVALAGAETYRLDLAGDGLLAIDVTQAVRTAPDGTTAIVTNSGVIRAAGGSVLLTATAASGLVEDLVRNTGRIETPTVGGRTGEIALRAEGGNVTVGGVVSARGGRNARGGTIEAVATGDVTVAAGARVIASGGTGGGRIAIGTDAASLPGTPGRLARNTNIAAGARIRADARRNGNGGVITINSTGQTALAGVISAQGGAQAGNGGFVEISGQGGVTIANLNTQVLVGAPHGSVGTLLLDPVNIIVRATPATGATEVDGALTAGAYTTDGAAGNPTTTIIAPTAITAFNGNVVLTATSALTVSAPVTKLVGTGALFLNAGTTLTINAALLISDGLQLSGASITIGAALTTALNNSISLRASGAINQTGGIITTGALGVTGLGGAGTSAGSISLTSAGNLISILAEANATGTNSVRSDVAAFAVTTASGSSLTLLAGGLASSLTLSGAVSAGTGALTLQANGAISQSGGTVTGGTLTAVGAAGTGTSALSINLNRSDNAITTVTEARATTTIAIRSDVTTLTVSQAAGAGVTLIAANAGGSALTLAGTISAGAGDLTLQASGAINQSSGTIVAATLHATGAAGAGTAADSIALFQAGNAVTTVSEARATNAIAIRSDVATLTISQADGTGVNFTAALAAGSAITLAGTITAGSGDLTLAANGAISQSGGTITAAGLRATGAAGTGTAADSITLTQANNAVPTIVEARATNAIAIRSDVATLTVDQAAGTGVALTAALAGGSAIKLNGTISAGTGDLALDAAGAITQPAGSVTAANVVVSGATPTGIAIDRATNDFGGFTGSASGAVTVQSQATTAGTLTLGAVSGTAVSIVSGGNLTTTAAITASTGDLALTGTGTVSIGANVTATLGNIAIQANADTAPTPVSVIHQTAGTIGAPTDTGVIRLTANSIQLSGTDTTTGTTGTAGTIILEPTSVGFAFDSTSLTSIAAVHTGRLIVGSATAGDLTFASLTLTPHANTVELLSAGNITQSGAGQFNVANLSATATGNFAFRLSNTIGAIVGSTADGTKGLVAGGNVALSTNAAALTLNAAVQAGSGNSITLLTDALTFSAGGSIAVTGAGTVNLLPFTATTKVNLGTNAVDTGGLYLTTAALNLVSTGGGTLRIGSDGTTTTAGAIAIRGTVALRGAGNGDAATLDLRGASVAEPAGTLNVATITGNAGTTSFILGQTTNSIDTVGAVTAGTNVQIVSSGALGIAGPVLASGVGNSILAGKTSLTLTGNVTSSGELILQSDGAILQSAGAIVAPTVNAAGLTVTNAASVSLLQTGNDFGAFAGSASGAIQVFSAATTAGVLTISDDVTAGSIAIQSGRDLLGANSIVATNALSLTGAGTVTLTGLVRSTAGDVTVTANVRSGVSLITQTLGTLRANSDTATIRLVANTITLLGVGNSVETGAAGVTGKVQLAPATSGLAITIGATVAGTLSIGPLGGVATGRLIIGDTSAGTINIAGATTAPAAVLELITGGSITQTAGATLAAATLSATATGAVTLNQNNVIAGVAGSTADSTIGISAGTDVVLRSSAALLTLNAKVTAGSGRTITLRAHDLAIPAGGGIVVAGAGTVNILPNTSGTAVTFGTAASPTGLILDNAELARIFSNGGLLRIGSDGTTTTAGTITVGNASLRVGAGQGAAILELDGAAVQQGLISNTILDVATLRGTAGTGSFETLSVVNTIDTLGTTSANAQVNVISAGALAVSGTITSSGSGADAILAGKTSLVLSGAISAGGGLTLASNGAITQSGLQITATTVSFAGFSVSNAGSVKLLQPGNDFGAIAGNASGAVQVFSTATTAGTLTVGTLGGASIAVESGAALATNGSVTAATGDLALTGVGTVTIATNVSATLGNVAITATPAAGVSSIVQTAGTITAPANDGVITLTSDSIALLAAAGSVRTGPGGTTGNVILAPATVGLAITLAGTLAGTQSITAASLAGIQTGRLTIGSTAAGAINVATAFTSPATVLELITGGSITQSNNATITANGLSATAAGSIALTQANAIDAIEGSAATPTIGLSAGTDLALTNSVTLNLNALVTAGSGRTITIRTDALNIPSIGGIQVAGAGTVNILPRTAGTAMTLGTSGAPTGLYLLNAEIARIDTGGGLLRFGGDGTTTTAGTITIGGTVGLRGTAGQGDAATLDLRAANVGESSGASVNVANLTGGVSGSLFLGNSANLIDTLGAIAATTGVVGVVTDLALLVNGPITAGGATQSLLASGVSLTLAGNISATAGTIVLFSAGAINQTGGQIVAAAVGIGVYPGNVTTGAVTLLQPNNDFAAFGTFSGTAGAIQAFSKASGGTLTVNALTGTSIAVTSATNLTTAGTITATTGDLALTGAGTVTLGSNVAATLGTVAIEAQVRASTSAITQTAGAVTAPADITLTADSIALSGTAGSVKTGNGSVGTVTLLSETLGLGIAIGGSAAGTQSITGLASVQTGRLVIGRLGAPGTAAGDINVIGPVTTSAQVLELLTGGSIGQTAAGTIQAIGLSATAGGDILLGANNNVDSIAGSTATPGVGLSAGGNVTLVSTASLLVVNAEVVAGSGKTLVLAADNMGINARLRAPDGVIQLRPFLAGQPLTLGGGAPNTLSLTAAELALTGGNGADGQTNPLTRLILGSATAGNINVAGAIVSTAPILELLSGGSIGQAAGATITTAGLTATAAGSIALTEANPIGAIVGSTASATVGLLAGLDVSLTSNAALLAVNAEVVAGPGRALTLTADDLALAARLRAPAGTITLQPLSAGQAVTLGGTAGGTLSLTQTELALTGGNGADGGTNPAARLVLGSATAGAVTVAGPIALRTVTAQLQLLSGAIIGQTATTGTIDVGTLAASGLAIALGAAPNTVDSIGGTGLASAEGAIAFRSAGALAVNADIRSGATLAATLAPVTLDIGGALFVAAGVTVASAQGSNTITAAGSITTGTGAVLRASDPQGNTGDLVLSASGYNLASGSLDARAAVFGRDLLLTQTAGNFIPLASWLAGAPGRDLSFAASAGQLLLTDTGFTAALVPGRDFLGTGQTGLTLGAGVVVKATRDVVLTATTGALTAGGTANGGRDATLLALAGSATNQAGGLIIAGTGTATLTGSLNATNAGSLSGPVTHLEGTAGTATNSGTIGGAFTGIAGTAFLNDTTGVINGTSATITAGTTFTNLGTITATTTISLTGTTGLTLTNDVNSGTTLTLISDGAILQNGGRIVAPGVVVTDAGSGSTASVDLQRSFNDFGSFGTGTVTGAVQVFSSAATAGTLTVNAVTADSIAIASGRDLTTAGTLSATNALSLTGAGTVVLGSQVQSSAGIISVEALVRGGVSTISQTAGQLLASASAAQITLTADAIGLLPAANSVQTGAAGVILLQPETIGLAITLGATVANTLSLTALQGITTGRLIIGNADAGTITVGGAFTSPAPVLELLTAGSIGQSAGAGLSAAALSATAGGGISLLAANNAIQAIAGSTATPASGLTAAAGGISLNTTTALAIGANVSAGQGSVLLTASGAISTTAGRVISARDSTLTGGDVSLTAADLSGLTAGSLDATAATARDLLLTQTAGNFTPLASWLVGAPHRDLSFTASVGQLLLTDTGFTAVAPLAGRDVLGTGQTGLSLGVGVTLSATRDVLLTATAGALTNAGTATGGRNATLLALAGDATNQATGTITAGTGTATLTGSVNASNAGGIGGPATHLEGTAGTATNTGTIGGAFTGKAGTAFLNDTGGVINGTSATIVAGTTVTNNGTIGVSGAVTLIGPTGITLANDVAAGGTLTLFSAGAIAQTGGKIVAAGVFIDDIGSGVVASVDLRQPLNDFGSIGMQNFFFDSGAFQVFSTAATAGTLTVNQVVANSIEIASGRNLTTAGLLMASGGLTLTGAGTVTLGSQVTSNAGNIFVEALVRGGTSAIAQTAGQVLASATAGQITLMADAIGLLPAANSVQTGSSGVVLLEPETTGRAITIGATVAGTLSLTALQGITTGRLIIGNATAGDIAVGGAFTSPAPTLELLTGGGISQTAAITATNFSATAGTGSILLTQSNAITNVVGSTADAALGLSAVSGSVALTSNVALLGVNAAIVAGDGTAGTGVGRTLTLTADDMALAARLRAPGGVITLQPFTTGRAITLGGSAASTLSLTQAELALTGGNGADGGTNPTTMLVLGSGTAGALTIAGPVAVRTVTNQLVLLSGGTIGQTATTGTIDTAVLAGSGAQIALAGAANTVDAVGGIGLASSNGNIAFRTADALAVNSNISSAALATATLASVDLTIGGGLTVAAGVSIAAGQGSTTIAAAGTITTGTGAKLRASDAYTVANEANTADARANFGDVVLSATGYTLASGTLDARAAINGRDIRLTQTTGDLTPLANWLAGAPRRDLSFTASLGQVLLTDTGFTSFPTPLTAGRDVLGNGVAGLTLGAGVTLTAGRDVALTTAAALLLNGSATGARDVTGTGATGLSVGAAAVLTATTRDVLLTATTGALTTGGTVSAGRNATLLALAGSATNQAGGTIAAGTGGIATLTGSLNASNAGGIAGPTTHLEGTAGAATNTGSIGGAFTGIAGTAFLNDTTGTINGTSASITAGTTFTNLHLITVSGAVGAQSVGAFLNGVTGTISGSALSLAATGSTLTNAGTLSAAGNLLAIGQAGLANSGTIASSAGNIGLTATTGDLTQTAGSITANAASPAGVLTLTASAGNIVEGGGTIAVRQLQVTTGGGDGSLIQTGNAIGWLSFANLNGAGRNGTLTVVDSVALALDRNGGPGIAAGNVSITAPGIASQGANEIRISALGNGAIPGSIDLVADTMALNPNTGAGGLIANTAFSAPGGVVHFEPRTAGTPVSVGGGSTGLVLAGPALGTVTAARLILGNAPAGALTLAGPFVSTAPVLELLSGGAITQAAGATITATSLTATAGGPLLLGEANGVNAIAGSTADPTRGLTSPNNLTFVTTTPLLTLNATITAGSGQPGPGSTTIILRANDLAIPAAGAVAVLGGGQGTIDLLPFTQGGAVSLGNGAAGGLALDSAELARITTGGGLLRIGGDGLPVAPGTTTTAGNITLAGDVNLNPSAAQLQFQGGGSVLGSGHALTVGTVTATMSGDILLDNAANNFAPLAMLAGAGRTISLAAGPGQAGGLVLGGDLIAFGGLVRLASSGAIGQVSGTTIVTGTLQLSAGTTVTLSNTNAFGTLGSTSTGGDASLHGIAFTIAGPVNIGGAALVNADGDLTIAAGANLNATTFTLRAGGAIASAGNMIAPGLVSLTAAGSLAVTGGQIRSGGGDVTFVAGGGATLQNAAVAAANTLRLSAAGTVRLAGVALNADRASFRGSTVGLDGVNGTIGTSVLFSGSSGGITAGALSTFRPRANLLPAILFDSRANPAIDPQTIVQPDNPALSGGQQPTQVRLPGQEAAGAFGPPRNAPAGNVALNIDAGQSAVFLLVDGGSVTGNIAAGRVGLVGQGGTAELFGTLNAVTGLGAARFADADRPLPPFDLVRYRINGCSFTSINCQVPPSLQILPILLNDRAILRIENSRIDPSDIVIPNTAEDNDYDLPPLTPEDAASEDERRRRAATRRQATETPPVPTPTP